MDTGGDPVLGLQAAIEPGSVVRRNAMNSFTGRHAFDLMHKRNMPTIGD
jgi:hypothetical protein